MRVLYFGVTGDDVKAWQVFLRGIHPASNMEVSGIFDDLTKFETQGFQRASGVTPDGVVGPNTLGKAMGVGFDPTIDDRSVDSGPNWPSKPVEGSMSAIDRQKVFGTFSYVSAPVQGNPEAIRITDGWVGNNIVTVNVPQLVGVPGAPRSGNVVVHKATSRQFCDVWTMWERAGLLGLVLTWSGSWAPRYVRGSKTYLSNHAWGTAFDINAQWNGLGCLPALKGQKGSVRELVDIAYAMGFYWGGWFDYVNEDGKKCGRSDGMHFECFKVLP